MPYRVWYLGEAWAVCDEALPRFTVVGNKDYASYRSAKRAADRLIASQSDEPSLKARSILITHGTQPGIG